MKDITYALAVFFCTLISFGQCDYSLKMIDSYGDGWNGNTMNVSVNGTVVLTAATIPANGSELILPFTVTDGADVTTEWLGGGGFAYETSYEILDSTGTSVLSEAENSVTTGTITASCPSCVAPVALIVDSTSDTGAIVSWTAEAGDAAWQYELVLTGETPTETGTDTTDNPLTITGCYANTGYDLYIRTDCGDTESTWGMVSFTTLPVPFTMPGCFDFETGALGANAGLSSDIYSDASLDAGAAAFASDFGILLTGGNSGNGWTGGGSDTTETQAWVDNVTHQSAVSITVDATAETVVVLTFDLKQTYSYGAKYSNFRVTANGTQIGGTLNPTTAGADSFVNQYYDLSAYAGTSFNLKLEHSGKYNAAYSAPGDQSLIDNICITAPSCTQPSAATATVVTASSADMSWTLGATETAWNIEYGPAGFTEGTGTTDTATTTAYNLTGLDSNTTYHFYVQADCGDSTSNWVGPVEFTTSPACGDTLYDSGGATGNYSSNDLTTVTVYPDNAGDLVTFTFLSFETEANYDFLTVYDGPDVSATVVGVYDGATVPDAITSSHPTGALTFVFDSDGSVNDPGYEILISCSPAPTCLQVSDVTATNATTTTVDLGWTAYNSEVLWNIEYGPADFVQGAGTTTVANSNPFTLTGLDNNATYDFYVQADCGDGDTSAWVGPLNFTTLPVPFTMPGCFDFEDGVLGANAALSSEIYADASLDAGAAAFASDFGILLTGGDAGTGWTGGSTSTTETEAWVDNVTHQSAVSITVDATAETVVVLTFDLKQTYSYGPNYSNFRVTVDGTQIGATLNPTTESSDLFVNQYYDLGAYAGTSFDLKLEHSGKYNAASEAPGDQSLIDNICITAPTCTQPGAAIAEAITTSTADISWTLGDAETAWNIEYGPAGFTQGTGTTDATAAMAYDLSGLESNTTYHFYVQADCGTSTSDWVGPLVFTTAPGCGNTLFDTGGATGDYSGNESITVTIYPETAGDLVTFTFLSFETEANWDFLTVYDGIDATSDVLGSFSGANVPDPISSTNSTGALTFVFESDGFSNDPGYEILISCAPAPSCYPPTALTISNIAGTTADFDWTAGTGNSSWEYIIVPTGDPAPTGSGTAADVTSTQFTGLDFETTYDVYVRADCGAVDGFSTWSGPVTFTTTQQTNYTVDCASGVPVNINYCYTNNDTMFWIFTSTTGYPLTVTFNAGTIEGNYDDITIYDGLDNTGTVLFNNNANDMDNLAGLVIESTSTSMYIEVDSDGSSSCDASTFYTPWDFDVSCKSCITQTVDFDIIGDCDVSQEFFIDVDISDLGSATSVVVSDNLASATQTVTSTGVISFGPYTAGFNVIISSVNSDDDSCVVNSGAMTFLCPPPPNDCSIILITNRNPKNQV